MAKLDSILNEYCRNLPKLAGESSYFPSFFFDHLEEYFATINNNTDPDFLGSLYKNDDIKENESSFKTQLNKVINGLKQTIEAYLDGLPSKSYTIFKETINETYLKIALQTSQIKHIRRDQNFYRVRVGEMTEPIIPSELFHIPFDKRKLVGTQRFSIPGFPCLYAGNSLAVSFKEIDVFTDEKLASTKIARITNNSNILIVDIDPYKISQVIYNPIFGKNAKWVNDVYQASLLYPLIAACHCKISYTGEARFKIEYIIPQLLLQWFKETTENKLIQGIRYLSNRIDTTDDPDKMYNYVFPVIGQKECGHCDHLKHLFKVSEVIKVADFSFSQTHFSDKVAELENYMQTVNMHILPNHENVN